MDGFQAYGAGKAGGAFDPLTFLRQPQTVVRILCWLFSIVILGCVANEGYINRPEETEEFCIFNRNQNACNYAVAMGTLCFLCSAGFLALDVYFPQISGVKDRKKAVMADIGVSAFWSFVWFVGFCFLSNQWQVAKEEDNPLNEGADAARAAIIFSFFSVFTWAAQSLLAFQKFKLGADSVLFNQDYMDPNATSQVPHETPAPLGPEYSGYSTDQQQVYEGTATEQNYQGNTGYDEGYQAQEGF